MDTLDCLLVKLVEIDGRPTIYKVITIMASGSLDDHKRLCFICVHSFAALAKAVRLFIASLHTQEWVLKCALLIFWSTSKRWA